MLSVSPPSSSTLDDLYFQASQDVVDSSSIYGKEAEDAVLGPGWDISPAPSSSLSFKSSPSSSTPSPASENMYASSQSSTSTSSGLLIRSKYQGWERSFELHHDWPVPTIENSDEILIKNIAVGLNPVDFKSILYNFGIEGTPWILGRDIAGSVEQVGADVHDITPGQRVWLCADSRDVRSGAYQAYSIARRAHVGKISEEVTDEEAATLGTGLVTAAIAAYWFFNWNRALSLGGGAMPRASLSSPSRTEAEVVGKEYVLIYGGGSITGIYLTQLARLSGLRVISIASPSNFEYLTSLGATHCVDRYLDPEELQEQVLYFAGEQGIAYCIDTVGSTTSTICLGILHSKGADVGELICLAGDPKMAKHNHTEAVEPARKLRKDLSGKKVPTQRGDRAVKIHKISFSTTFYGDDTFAMGVMSTLSALIDRKELHTARPEVYPDGLAGIRRGLEALRDNQAPSAKKIVVNVLRDTPHSDFTNLGVRTESSWNGVV
ncbi:hypothetical protein CBS101457_003346 [Exobasidium rhododendri]|nr:hypothetical protein CBS101457_003346 [Exobasidium rhododendri]